MQMRLSRMARSSGRSLSLDRAHWHPCCRGWSQVGVSPLIAINILLSRKACALAVTFTVTHLISTPERRITESQTWLSIGESQITCLDNILHFVAASLAWLAKAKAGSTHSDSDGMGSISAIPDARNVPLLHYYERFNAARLPKLWCVIQYAT